MEEFFKKGFSLQNKGGKAVEEFLLKVSLFLLDYILRFSQTELYAWAKSPRILGEYSTVATQ